MLISADAGDRQHPGERVRMVKLNREGRGFWFITMMRTATVLDILLLVGTLRSIWKKTFLYVPTLSLEWPRTFQSEAIKLTGNIIRTRRLI
jgi:hypothetical protein